VIPVEDNVARLKSPEKDRFCDDAESLLGQVTTLVCLVNVKAKESGRQEGSSECRSAEESESSSDQDN